MCSIKLMYAYRTAYVHALESYIYDCDPWPSDHRAVITEFSICINSNIGDINSDYLINIQDILILINGILNSYDSHCLFLKSDVDINGDLNVIDIIQIVNIILGANLNPTDYELWAADLNQDDNIDILDIVLIVNMILE